MRFCWFDFAHWILIHFDFKLISMKEIPCMPIMWLFMEINSIGWTHIRPLIFRETLAAFPNWNLFFPLNKVTLKRKSVESNRILWYLTCSSLFNDLYVLLNKKPSCYLKCISLAQVIVLFLYSTWKN